MYAPQRQDTIAEDIRENGGMSVTDLAERFGVSTETIRRDLAVLEKDNRVTRVHGGAVPYRDRATNEDPIDDRQSQEADAKTVIAELAAAYLPTARGSVIVDSGTTTALLAERVAQTDNVSVVTNSLLFAHRLSRHGHHDLHVIGGRVRGVTQAIVGTQAVEDLRGLRADIAFLGANGVTADFGFSTLDPSEARTKEAMVRAARSRIVLADSTKLGEDLLCRFASPEDVDLLITDAKAGHPVVQELRAQGLEVVHP